VIGKLRRVRRRLANLRTAPTSKGVALLAFAVSLFLIGVNTGSTWLYLLASACSMIVVVSAPWSSLPLRRLRARRHGIVRATIGELIEYPVTVSTLGSGGRFVVWDPATDSRPAIVEVSSRSIEDVEGILRAVPRNRGVYSSPPLVAACYAPFGLWRTRRTVPCEGDVEVAPPIFEIALPVGLTTHVLNGEGKREPPKRGKGYEFFALREYLPGDPVRHIYWPASARRDEVIVREFEEEGTTPVAVLVVTSPPADAMTLDRVLSVAGSLVRAAVKAHIPVRLVIPGGFEDPGRGPLVLASPSASVLRSTLARVQAPVARDELLKAVRLCREAPMGAVVGVKSARSAWPEGLEGVLDFAIVVAEEEARTSVETMPSAARMWIVPPRGDICFDGLSAASAA